MKRYLAVIVSTFTFVSFAFAGETVFSTGANSDGTYEFKMIKDEGLKVGNGTPSTTQDGEDVYIEGGLEVDGAVRHDGAVTNNSTTALVGLATFTLGPVIPAVDVTVSSPTVTGQIVRTSDGEVYISTGTGVVSAWSKVGGQ